MKPLSLLLLVAVASIQLHAQQPEVENSCRHTKNFTMHQHDLLKNEHHSVLALTGDTIHVAHYAISIDTINYAAQSIRAHTAVVVVCKMNNVNNISLSLLQLTVDSITSGNQLLAYTYNDTTLRITPVTVLNQGDTLPLTVYYHGVPKKDASGWGGFYFAGNYAFNLGVGFAADPHVYGRVWFPCIDEFTDRATYDFYITTGATSKAFCNGALISQTNNPDGTVTWHWALSETIPTYLACMAVAPFYTLQQNIAGVPVEMAVMAVDTPAVLVTFQHLDTVLNAFINAYGPYPFEKVGYSMVPFNSGAMEHASQITIGKAFIDGTLNYETLWAHELSHMWWGDKVTCETAGDMWLNEGWASFNEAFMTQIVYGDVAYHNWIRTNNRKVLQFAHIVDGSYLSFINVPHAYTYGNTVYSKGANVVHTLRYYMGDTAFFNACKYHQNVQAYSSSNSYQLRDNFTASSGIDMTRFFDDWVFTEGFPHFSIDSVTEYIGAFNHYYIHCRQRSKGNTHLYQMPLEINLTDGVNDTTFTFVMDSATQTFHVALLFTPLWFSIDREDKISDAISAYEKPITATGSSAFPETNCNLNVLSTGTATTVRIEHNFVAPDDWKQSNPGIRLSNYHYWKVDGLWDSAFLSKATFSFNGSTSGSTGYLDNTLITGVEDSLELFWRAGTYDDWHFIQGITANYGANHNDKVGNFVVDTLKKGEYVLGYRDYTVGIKKSELQEKIMLQISPNPASHKVHFEFDIKNFPQALLQLYDMQGRIIKEFVVYGHQSFVDWDTTDFKSGNYVARLCVNDKITVSKKLVLAN